MVKQGNSKDRAVIFDIDGTLVDSVDLHARAWLETLQHFGYGATFQEVRSQIGKGGDQLLPLFVPEGDLKRLGEKIQNYRKRLYTSQYLSQVRPFPRVRQLFERIKAEGRRIGLASSAKGDELSHYKRLTGIDDLVEAQTSSDDAEKSKPHPDIFLAALEQLGNIEPQAVIVIGDTPYDAVAAHRAGVDTVIGLLCGGFPADDLRKSGCVELYRNPADLLIRYDDSVLARATVTS